MLLFAKVADRDRELCVGAIFDVLNGEFFFEMFDHAFSTQESGGLTEDEHGNPAVEEAGVEE